MEQITLDLQPEPSTPRMRIVQRVLFLLIGISNIVQGIISDNGFRFVNLVFGAGVIVVTLLYRKIFKPKIFTFDEDGLDGPVNATENVRVRWADIYRIEASMFGMKLCTKTRGDYKIYLGNLTYTQLKQIKPKILQLANAKGVDVRV